MTQSVTDIAVEHTASFFRFKYKFQTNTRSCSPMDQNTNFTALEP